jgi:leucyl-tRNA synthetase
MQPANQEEHKTKEQTHTRRDKLVKFEKEAQKIWQEKHIHEINPDPNNTKKFFVTFPYPYMNGRLHLGHAYTMSKCEFTARYKKLKGFNSLFPFGYHCTGMPIVAAADKLKREFNNHPDDIATWAAGLEKAFKEEVEIAKHDPKYEVQTKLPQYVILKMSSVPEADIKKFIDPTFWLTYFPPIAAEDLKTFGAMIDHRRSFITTDLNPYYDSFIMWQFHHLKERNRISFGKRPTIFSGLDKQPCADHERTEGEGVGPQEYTLVKLKVVEPLPAKLEKLAGRAIYMVAATLRPETMYGQTNCFVLPTGEYGAYEMHNDEIFICSDKSAKNMAWQEMTKIPEKHEALLTITGEELIGAKLKAPLTSYEYVYALPMMTISMDKGTGIVTSVPSDAPDDWATLRDIQKKQPLREKFKIKDEWVMPYEPVPIIDVPGYGNLSALKACEEFKVTSQNDKDQLTKAKDTVYLKGFYSGVFTVEKYKGIKVQEAKPQIREEMIKNNQACTYYEPEKKVVARSGDVCVVALCDQWYLKYSDENWKKLIMDHIKQAGFKAYNDAILKSFEEAIDWLKDWGVSRNYGLGSRLPWDKQFLIESLSDSTIYMAYYTVAHLLQTDLIGKVPGTLDIKPEELNVETWNYIFFDHAYNDKIKIPEEKLKKLRAEFKYFYPLDLRCSAKDLIRNHLSFSLYNHAAMWENQPNLWPQGFFCNGYISVNGQKMAKSLGNFMTVDDCVKLFGADATRIALADAGDTLDDANFVPDTADNAILRLNNLEMWIKLVLENKKDLREPNQIPNKYIEFVDHAFASEVDRTIHQTEVAYESMRYRDVLKFSFFDFTAVREEYKIRCGPSNMRLDLVLKYIEAQLLLLYPICPHFAEIVYKTYVLPNSLATQNKPELITYAKWPEVDASKLDVGVLEASDYLKELLKRIRGSIENQMKKIKNKEEKPKVKKMTLIVRPEYHAWQKKVLTVISSYEFNEKGEFKQLDKKDEWKNVFKNDETLDQAIRVKALQFGAFIIGEVKSVGKTALQQQQAFNEKDILQINADFIKKESGVEDIALIDAEEAMKSGNKNLVTFGQNAIPGKPQIQLEL